VATIEAIASHDDGDFLHDAEVKNKRIADAGAGILASTLSLTVTGADRVITYPSFACVVPNGTGGLVARVAASGTVTADIGESAGPRIDILVYDNSDAAVKLVKGVATAETGDVSECPMPELTDDQILIARSRIEQSASVITAANVKGRGIEIREQVYSSSVLTKNNNDTLASIPGMAFVMGASQTWNYTFEAQAVIGATPDIKVAMTLPAAATGTGYVEKVNAASHFGARMSDVTASTALADAAAGVAIRGFGTIVNSTTPGTAQVQAAQNTATSEDTTIYAGGCIRAWRVA